MIRTFCLILFSLAFQFVQAHNPNTAAASLSNVQGVWMLDLSISQVGANVALNKRFPELDLSDMPETEFKQLYMDYLKQHIQLEIDGNEIELSSGGIKLGKHQSNIRFLIPTFPTDYNMIHVFLPIFSENQEQNTVFRFMDAEQEVRKVLNTKNNFTVGFWKKETGFEEVSNGFRILNAYIIEITVFFVLLIIGLYTWIKYRLLRARTRKLSDL